ncbi:MAG TPA: exodeoxyribonuclease VII small subunit [Clostridiales bacterium UBA8153]|nr:exodeoxyribonuclease VII small subunit [Clostridiales bacterium UBA8153]
MEQPAPEVTQERPSFEVNLQRLEEVVQLLETGELSLERALALLQEGMGLVRVLGGQLDEAESRIDQAIKGAGGTVLVPLAKEGP